MHFDYMCSVRLINPPELCVILSQSCNLCLKQFPPTPEHIISSSFPNKSKQK